MLDILHMHGFKCAGTTFAWILERNYPDQVAYVESLTASERLAWQLAAEQVASGPWRAVTSHLSSMPPPGNPLARLTVALVREPRRRLWSAYGFEQRLGTVPETESFAQFLERVRHIHISNYQTRHLSPQDDGGWLAEAGWQLRPDLLDLDRQDVFVGLVEEFDKSMVLLERRLAGMGIAFDASYHKIRNRSVEDPASDDVLQRIPCDMVDVDREIHQRVAERVRRQWEALADGEAALVDYRERCERAADTESSVTIKRVGDWIRIDPVTGEALKEVADVSA